MIGTSLNFGFRFFILNNKAKIPKNAFSKKPTKYILIYKLYFDNIISIKYLKPEEFYKIRKHLKEVKDLNEIREQFAQKGFYIIEIIAHYDIEHFLDFIFKLIL